MPKKRIPTIIGLLLLIVGSIVGVVFVSQQTSFIPRAAPEYTPQQVKISNITDVGFAVSWYTEEPINGYLKMGDKAATLDNVIQDERDQLSGSSKTYRNHYISISNLSPGQTYYFKIYSDKQGYDCQGKVCSITTGAVITTQPQADTIYGNVFTSANTPSAGSLVYLNFPNAVPISALTKEDGNWSVKLSSVRSLQNLQNYATYDANTTKLDIVVKPESGALTRVSTLTSKDQPVPDIIIGTDADYSNATASDTTPTPVPSENTNLQLTIDTLPENDPRPVIKGSAPAGVTLSISVHSNQAYTDTVTADSTGSWDYTPPGDLEPGTHTIVVSYNDPVTGELISTTKTFVISSAEATKTATSSSTTQTTSPKYSASPSAEATPVPARVSRPATSSGVPVAGTTTPTYILSILSCLLIICGWFLLKKPGIIS